MSLPVSLQSVINEMDMQNDMVQGYINRKTGELTVFTEEDEYALRRLDDGEPIEELPAWQQEIIPKLREIMESDDFIELPSQFEIHEYSIMEDFIYSLDEGPMKDDLLNAIRGRGAFRMFKDKIFDYNIRDDWFNYKNKALKKIAIDFLELNEIPFEDDCGD
ncbi:UPF0158 family protein [Rhodohalobacter sulfatireducens]|uniref:UPF0158 family protein n=1 Tax=Rhodohalobacter sulfatireducens TaxID=2911366 RepID=A0ABS9KJQ7_9BACT|nr:UPF0158 family protein [Rhodohalobacter sulfatireducens]MCG2591059.1 UPF0158 family protein [Rhodohalobacter sulfatireducens]